MTDKYVTATENLEKDLREMDLYVNNLGRNRVSGGVPGVSQMAQEATLQAKESAQGIFEGLIKIVLNNKYPDQIDRQAQTQTTAPTTTPRP